jgi:hypothetical protein
MLHCNALSEPEDKGAQQHTGGGPMERRHRLRVIAPSSLCAHAAQRRGLVAREPASRTEGK